MKKQLFQFLLAVVGLTSIFSCKKVIKNEQYYREVSKYVYAYTSGTIARDEVVRVKFARPVVSSEAVGKPVSKDIFHISPMVGGQAIWEDASSIRFKPEQPWEFGKKFSAQVQLHRLFAAEKPEVKVFDFEFRVRQLAFEVVSKGLASVAGKGLGNYQGLGYLQTSVAVPGGDAERLLRATQNGKELKINWLHDKNQLRHHFTVEGIERGARASKVVLSWSGKPFQLPNEGTMEWVVPAQDDFSVVQVLRDRDHDHVWCINFSDPLSNQQDVSGLVRLHDLTPHLRFSVEGNNLLVYCSQAVTGSYTLEILPGIRNATGKTLTQPYSQVIDFQSGKPAIQLVGRGNIIPRNEQGRVLFPFEAMGLTAVDVEIFKIYNSNILQFLQVNNLDGSNELERVGKIIFQKKVALSDLDATANQRSWARYTLDLQEVVGQDPTAIYQIRLAFRKSYTIEPCTDQTALFPADDHLTRTGRTDAEGNLKSIFGDYQGIYFSEENTNYYDDNTPEDFNHLRYDWSQRENPCRPEYYNYQHFVSRNAFVSDVGITAKFGTDGSMFIATTDLNTADPLGGVDLQFYNYQLQPVLNTCTQRDGTLLLEKLPENTFVVLAIKGDRRGYLKINDGNSLSLSRFDVSGVAAQKGIKGYLYGDRGVWRPGDSLYLNFVLEDQTGKMPVGHPVSLEVTDPRGARQIAMTQTQPVGGIYPFHIATAPDAPTGNWIATISAGGAKFSQVLKIETVKPNRLKINLDFGKKYFESGDQVTGHLSASWLHGAPASHLKSKVEIQVQQVKTTFKGYSDFVFDDPTRKMETDLENAAEKTLDASGNTHFTIQFSNQQPAPGKLVVHFKTRVFENSGDFSTDHFSMDYYPYPSFVGISMPKNKYGESEIEEGKTGTIQLVCVDKNGKPLANRKLEVGLYRCEWRWWWDSDEWDNIGQFNSATHINAQQRATLTTNARGEASWKVTPNTWGRYLVRATDATHGTDLAHCTGDFFWTGYPAATYDSRAQAGIAMLAFSTDKSKYNLGEEVTLNVPASENGQILVCLENGSRVIEYFWRKAKSGDNSIRFKVNERMVPNVYAHVSLFQPHAQTKNSLPIRMYGVVPVEVENPASRLEPQIAMPEVIHPGENVAISVSEKSGRPCSYTLAIVDEGLLDLTRFKTPNPHEAFFAREALGVKTWDIYDYVLGAFGIEMSRLLAVGGDDFNQKSRLGTQVSRFKPVVKHFGPFTLKKGERALHRIKIENYVGSVRAMLVCSSVGGGRGKNAYGAAEKTVPVRQALMVQPTLPRVLSPGERLRLPVHVFALENKVKNAAVTVSESSGLVQVLQRNQQLEFAKPGDKMTYFDLQVGNREGVAKFKISGSGGGETASESIEIMVRNPHPPVTLVENATLPAGGRQEWTINRQKFSQIRDAVLEVSPLPLLNFSHSLHYLIQYPHGCVEQVTSAAFPQLYVHLVAPLSDAQKEEVQRHVTAAIQKLSHYQLPSGGFGYWQGDGIAHDWSSSYVGHFLVEAKNSGYFVPQPLLDHWIHYQTNAAKSWNEQPAHDPRHLWRYYDAEIAQAYRLYSLALAGKPDAASMNRLREQKNKYRLTNLLLAAAYSFISKTEAARELLAQKDVREWQYSWHGNTFGSETRDLALLLEVQTQLGDPSARQSLEKLAIEMGKAEGGHSTQELATALRACSKYLQKNFNRQKNEVVLAVGGSAPKNYQFDTPVLMLPLENGSAAEKSIILQNKSKGQLYARLTLSGQPLEAIGQPFANHIQLEVKYWDVKGNPLNVSSLKQGTDFVAEVTVVRQSDLQFDFNELALTQVFPSGWEIAHARHAGMTATHRSAPMDYQDIRDDRVLTYLDLPYENSNNPTRRTYRVHLTAAYAGKFYMPGVACEAMYDRRISAGTVGQWVEVN